MAVMRKALASVFLFGVTAEAFVPSSFASFRPCLELQKKHRRSSSTSASYSAVPPAARRSPLPSRLISTRWTTASVIRSRSVRSTPRMSEEEDFEKESDGDIEKRPTGYTDVTVREAVEWTMSRDSEFAYIDVRSAEEHEKLATPRGSISIPAFEKITAQEAAAASAAEASADKLKDIINRREEERSSADEEDSNYEHMEWNTMPDFVDRMKAQYDLDAKLLIGCKTNRSGKACQLLADAGFTEIYNVESQIFMRTRAPDVWE